MVLLCFFGKLRKIVNYGDITWASWHLKSLASLLVVQQHVQRTYTFVRGIHWWFLSERDSNRESISIWFSWCHHDLSNSFTYSLELLHWNWGYFIVRLSQYQWSNTAQRAHDVKITSLLRRNDVTIMTLLWRRVSAGWRICLKNSPF